MSGDAGLAHKIRPPASTDEAQDVIRRLRILEEAIHRLGDSTQPCAMRASPRAQRRVLCAGAAAFFVLLAGAPIVFAQAEFKGIFIDRAGNVGIGTNEPGNDRLRVNGNLGVEGPIKVGTESVSVTNTTLRLVRGAATIARARSAPPAGGSGYKLIGGNLYRTPASIDRNNQPVNCSLTGRVYDVVFDKPFAAIPVAFVTALNDQGSGPAPPNQDATILSLDKDKAVIRASTPDCREPPGFWFAVVGPA